MKCLHVFFLLILLCKKQNKKQDNLRVLYGIKSHHHQTSLTSYLSVSLSCPVLSNEQTLTVLKNGQGPEAMFRIQMFKFVGSSYTDVFLHCNVQICHNTPGVCQPVSQLM